MVTIDLKVDFLSPVLDQKIIVSGKRVKAGKTIYLTEAQMINENGKVFAHGTSKLLVINNKQTMNEVVDYVSAERLPSKFVK